MMTIDRIAYRANRKPGEPPLAELPPVPKAIQRLLSVALLETEVTGAQLVHQLENAPSAACDAGERVIRYDDGQAGLFREQLVYVAQQCAATGEHDATFRNVGSKLGRSLLQRLLHGADDALQGFLQRFQNFVAVQGEAARYAFGKIASLHRQLTHLLTGIGRADFDLDALSRRLTDQDAVVPADVVHDRFVEAIATDARGVGIYDAVQGEDRDFRGTAADIQYHGPTRFVNGQSGTDGRRHRLADNRHVAGTGTFGGFADGAALDLCGTERHAHEDAGRGLQHAVAVHLVDKMLKHFFGVREV